MEKVYNNLPAYVKDNSWEQELNYKLWSTKSARFQASHRLLTKANLSNASLALLSSYLIIINLAPTFITIIKIDVNIISFFTTAISILLLVYTQIESANEYKLNAHLFHQCALEIADLYNELRIAKNIQDEYEKNKKILEITNQYQSILKSYENHHPIDGDMFQVSKFEYHKLNIFTRIWIHLEYFVEVQLKYYSLITIPPLLFYIVLLNYSQSK